ncbi:MAG: hypothetical protein AAF761_09130 [Pseudomonadota bacterium]
MSGVYAVATKFADCAVGNAPDLEGLDVPLLALRAEEVRAMVDAARPMLAAIFRTRYDAQSLAIMPYPPR